MLRSNIDAIYHKKSRYLWYLLGLQGGIVNAGGFLSVHRYVSHVTGFATALSISVNESRFLEAFFLSLVPLFFLIGAFCSGIFTEAKRMSGKPPIYIYSLFCMAILFCVIGILGKLGFLGQFGESLESIRDYFILAVLSFCCGMQNALFTSFSGAVVRTTHLTGITTDLGIDLAKSMYFRDQKTVNAISLRLGLILSFIVGSYIGVVTFKGIGFSGFFVPAVLSSLIALILYFRRRSLIRIKNI